MPISNILGGTYEGGLVGFTVSPREDHTLDIEQTIFTTCHIGCVRSLASAGKYAVTGGTDEMINVFDIKRKAHLGNMGGSVHSSTLTAVAVAEEPGLIISACEEGQIAITRLKDFETLKSFKGHKGAVYAIAVHPSGKIALTISADRTLRMWDLVRGTCAAVRNIGAAKRPARGVSSSVNNMMVKYTPQGTRYVVLLADGSVDVCSSTSTEISHFEASFNYICPLTEALILAGNTKGSLTLLEITGTTVTVVSELEGVHDVRVRGLARIASDSADSVYGASVCSDGRIVFVRFDTEKRTFETIRTIETGMRITAFSSNV